MDQIELNINGVLQNLTWGLLSEKLGAGVLREDLNTLNSTVSNNIRSMNISWLISSATLVFIMQAGFTMQEVGSVRVKNTKSILVKNLLDVCIGSLLFYLCGFAFAFGEGNAFIGWTGFAMQSGFKNGTSIIRGNTLDMDRGQGYNGYEYAFWVFQFAFSATTSTIVSGAVAERTKLSAYGVYTFVLSFVVYPVVVHWGWSDDGWASPYGEASKARLFGVGIIDFAGSCMVHMVGGTSALVGAFVVGPRKGRFGQYRVFIQQQNTTFQVVGTLLLWFGWYGFNTGATLGINGVNANVAAKVAANTTLSAASAGFVVMLMGWFLERKIEPAPVCNGILAGLVSITAGCSVIEPELTLVTGCLGGVIYYWSSKLLVYWKIDDVVDASPVHLCCGLWGTLAAGLFAHPGNTAMAHHLVDKASCGLVYGGNGGHQFAANLVFCLVVLCWTSGIMGATFTILKIARLFRVTGDDEDFGLDKITHGGLAYENPVHQKDSYKDDSQRTTHFTSNGLDMISSPGQSSERSIMK